MEILNYILHLDQFLESFLNLYQEWFYLILFLLIFIETGLVIMPFLPGDSLLFASGMLAATYPDQINIYFLLIVLFVAAILGDTTNYLIGRYFGNNLIRKKIFGKRLIKDSAILKTQRFFTTYGGKTIVLARFIPVVRTLAPFVAGISTMNYKKFIQFNIIGGAVWILGITLIGYFLGSIELVKNNFEFVVLMIILFSLLPILFELIKTKIMK